ncbi:putative glycoside hydrolase [Geomicrobium sp. JSM 1781026]|uniref:putative glycoside hydrolase n=1 Tax=Geomicrobium sp. JSM 1781026 TaxID=3344580 RepID=UPI0035C105AF
MKLLKVGAIVISVCSILLAGDIGFLEAANEPHPVLKQGAVERKQLPIEMKRFAPANDGVKGVYVSAHSAGGERLNSLIQLVEESELNAMVIDVKDDYGNITFTPESGSAYTHRSSHIIDDPEELLKQLNQKNIYPIARVVVFKDTRLAMDQPELSFLEDKQVWKNNRDEAFVNPFREDVWAYNVDVAKMAARLGFKEIQFDYVRFPEGFETRDELLTYDFGEYTNASTSRDKSRVQAVTDFVEYAKEELRPFHIDVSVDIFGYAATVDEAAGIGQNFSQISEHVDVISSMIYPSHWTAHFGIEQPDKEPYRLTSAYAQMENDVLAQVKNAPKSRPWIQDFTASWLGEGNYIPYGKEEVEAQIQALHDHDIHEYLLWNAGNHYTEGVNYTPKRSSSTF